MDLHDELPDVWFTVLVSRLDDEIILNTNTTSTSVCDLVYKPEARVEYTAGRSIKIVCKIARLVDLNFGLKF